MITAQFSQPYQFLLKLRTDLHTIPCLLQNISREYLASHPTINSQNDGAHYMDFVL